MTLGILERNAWPDSLLNGSEMGSRIRHFDWSSTSLGPIESWPQILRSFVAMLVDNRFPMYIFWGPENIAIYNDGYIPMAGDKHPRMLGMATEIVWGEVWPLIAPLLASAKSGEAVNLQDLELTLLRYGFPEEFYCSFCYSPLRDESGEVAGVLATVNDTTHRILSNRRLEALRALATSASFALTEADAMTGVAEALQGRTDLPFAAVYLAHEGSLMAQMAAQAGTVPHGAALPASIPLSHDALAAVPESFPDPERVVAVPIGSHDGRRYTGALIAGLNPRLRYDEPYREFVGMVAAQIGNSVAAARAFSEERARAESMQITRTIEKIGLFAESAQQLFWTTRPDGPVDWYHKSWYDYTGKTYDRDLGWAWKESVHPDDLPEVMRRWPEALERRAPFEMTFRLRGADGRYRWFLSRAVPEFDENGQVTRWYGTNTNIDSERRAAQQLDALAALGDRLVQTPDLRGALYALAHGLVPNIADWTLINIADENGALHLAAAHHRDADLARVLEPYLGTQYDPHGATAAVEVFKTGKPVVIGSTDPSIARGRVADDFAAAIELMGMASIVIVPIVANGDILGTFHAASTHSEKTYGEQDLPFFEEIGRRIGYAIQNAQAYEREWRIAHAFQSAALPGVLPSVPGLHFSSLYEPASHEANVGGDFYDAFRLLDGRVVVSIGDVAGAGLGAAATMAELRQSIRAVASVNPDPEMLLKAADGVFSDTGRAPFASAFVAVIDPLTFSIQYANAGHPAPLLRRPDGSLQPLGGNDLLLGIGMGTQYGARQVGKAAAEPGSLLVLYTDGLTEATRDPLDGEFRLQNAVRGTDAKRETAPRAARAIWEAVVGAGGSAHDDVAVLAVFLETPLLESPAADVSRWSFRSEDGEMAHAVRNRIVAKLAAAGMRDEDIFAAQMVYSELVGNVFRHAGTSLDVALDLTQDAAVLHVLDSGEGFSLNPKLPADAYSERGRGIYIVTELTREFAVTPRTMSYGSHARAVLHGRVLRSTSRSGSIEYGVHERTAITLELDVAHAADVAESA